VPGNPRSKKPEDESKDAQFYLFKTKDGYEAVGDKGAEIQITDDATVNKIKTLVEKRKKAGEDLTELIVSRGVTAASINNATHTLGAGE
jgi:hypothetical protein